jgi:hypothetical protein
MEFTSRQLRAFRLVAQHGSFGPTLFYHDHFLGNFRIADHTPQVLERINARLKSTAFLCLK